MAAYKIIGADGREYGPADADQVRRWILEKRLTKRSPVWAPDSAEWTQIGALPEFAGEFGAAAGGPAGSVPPVIQPCPAAAQSDTSMAKAGLICGILSVTVCCGCCGLPLNLLGLIFSSIALVQIGGDPRRYSGAGMAVTGLVLSASWLCAALFGMIFW